MVKNTQYTKWSSIDHTSNINQDSLTLWQFS